MVTAFTPLVARLRQSEMAGQVAEARFARENVRADQAEARLKDMHSQLSEAQVRVDERLQRFALLKKRSVLRLPRWLVQTR